MHTRTKSRIVVSCAAIAAAFVGCFSFGDLQGGANDCPTCGGDGASLEGSSEATANGQIVVTVAPSLVVQQGQSGTLTVTIARGPGVTGPVNVTLSSLPTGASSKVLALGASDTSGIVTVDVDGKAPQSSTTIRVVATTSDGTASGGATTQLVIRGPSGSVDETFGDHGFLTGSTLSITPSGAALDANGNLLVAGELGNNLRVFRFTPAGLLDTTFGSGGYTDVLVDPFNDFPGIFSLASGSYLLTGERIYGATGTAAWVRLGPSGAVDMTFSPDGGAVRDVSMGLTTYLHAFTMDSLGDITMAGGVSGTPLHLYISRRTAVGDSLPGFEDSMITLGTSDASALAMAAQSDGGFLFAVSSTQGGHTGASLYRIVSTGHADGTFGAGGYVAPDVSTDNVTPSSLVIQSDGKIIMSGYGSTPVALRYTSLGAHDTAWASSGVMATNLGAGGAALQPDDKLVMAGPGTIVADSGASSNTIEVGRFNTDGSRDTTFGNAGTGSFTLPGEAITMARVLLQPNGEIVLVCTMSGKLVLARFWP